MKSRRALGKPIQSEVGVSKTKNRPRGSVFVLSRVDKKDATTFIVSAAMRFLRIFLSLFLRRYQCNIYNMESLSHSFVISHKPRPTCSELLTLTNYQVWERFAKAFLSYVLPPFCNPP